MVQNLIWSTGYNLIAIPLAAVVLYKWNIMLSPAMGAVLMSLSTVIVAIKAKLWRVKIVSSPNSENGWYSTFKLLMTPQTNPYESKTISDVLVEFKVQAELGLADTDIQARQ